MKKLLIACFVFLLACEEDGRLYIDNNCNADEVRAIYTGADKINRAAGYERIEIGGIRKIKNSDILNDGLDSITCLDDNPGDERHTGEAFASDILLYRDNIANYNVLLAVVIHEMVHYIAQGRRINLSFVDEEEHIDNENCIMWEYVDENPPDDFCEEDIEFIRSVT